MAGGPITAMIMHPVVKEELLRESHLQRLERTCRLVDPTPFRNFDGLGDEAARVQVLITSWGCPRIDRTVVSTLPGLKLIAHLAGSVKGFIDENVWRMGVQITNAVAANAVPVAEYTLAAILFSNKRVLQLADFYRHHHENRAPWTKEAPNVGNYKKTVGLIGASHVGRKVLELLRPFDMKVLMYDPYMTPLQVRELGAHKVGLSELLSNSDVASMHAPLLPETRHMLGAREFALMKDGATFINTARSTRTRATPKSPAPITTRGRRPMRPSRSSVGCSSSGGSERSSGFDDHTHPRRDRFRLIEPVRHARFDAAAPERRVARIEAERRHQFDRALAAAGAQQIEIQRLEVVAEIVAPREQRLREQFAERVRVHVERPQEVADVAPQVVDVSRT